MRLTKIAISGSSGFIGSKLVKKLVGLNYDCIFLDRSHGIDLTDWKHVRSIQPFDALFHLAAKTYIPSSFDNPREFFFTNIVSTINLLELCRVYDAKMIFTSSYVYGTPRYLPIDEEHPISGSNPYTQSKIICEDLCKNYHDDYKIDTIIIRPFNVYGINQNSNFLIPTIIEQSKRKKIVLRDPNPKRDYVYLDDLINLFIRVLTYDVSYDVFNAGSGISYSVKEIVEMICDIIDEDIYVEYENSKRINEVMETRADISKVRNKLKWVPKINFKQGLEKIINNNLEE